MDYTDIFSIIGDLNEVKGGKYYEPVHYKLNYDTQTNIEQFLDKFTDMAFNDTDENSEMIEKEDNGFIDLVTEENETMDENAEVMGDDIEESNENNIEEVGAAESSPMDEDAIVDDLPDVEENYIEEEKTGNAEDRNDNITTLGDWKDVNLEEVARENREVREIAYEGKTKLKKEIEQEKSTFDEDPKSAYKDINDLITRYKDVI